MRRQYASILHLVVICFLSLVHTWFYITLFSIAHVYMFFLSKIANAKPRFCLNTRGWPTTASVVVVVSLATRVPWTYGRWALGVHTETITPGGNSRIRLREVQSPHGDIKPKQNTCSGRNSLAEVPESRTCPSKKVPLKVTRPASELRIPSPPSLLQGRAEWAPRLQDK
jgi:hypothetical protein